MKLSFAIFQLVTATLLVPAILLADDAARPRQSPPMLVSVSHTSPDTRYIRLHADEQDAQPFTGTLVCVSWPPAEQGRLWMGSQHGNLSWAVFKGERFEPQMIEHALEDMREVKLSRAKDNLLWMTLYLRKGADRPEVPWIDWYDDEYWAISLHNAEMLARFAKEAGLKGLMFDVEEYGCALWSWNEKEYPQFALSDKPEYAGKTPEDLKRKIRERGVEVVKAINRGFPGCQIWTTHGYGGYAVFRTDDELRDFWNTSLNIGRRIDDGMGPLAVAFMDGMVEGSDEQTILVDGNERAYYRSEREDFETLRKCTMEKALLYTTLPPDVYLKKVRVGFGIYLDYHPHLGWNSEEPEKNEQTPERLERAVRNALEVSDGYVWVYSERPSWWLRKPDDVFAEGVAVSREPGAHRWIPQAYHDGLRRALGE